jgi:predicted ATPase
MERLTHVKVKGFRSLRDVELEMRPLNVLIGANGSGKSNLIAALDFLNMTVAGYLGIHVARQGGATSVLHYGPQYTQQLVAELHFAETSGVSGYTIKLVHAASDRLAISSERVDFARRDNPTSIQTSSTDGRFESFLQGAPMEGLTPSQLAGVQGFLDRSKSLQCYRFHDTRSTADIRNTQQLHRNTFLQANGGNLAAFLHRLSVTHPRHFELITEMARHVVPFLQRFELTPNALDPNSIQMRWRDRNPDYEFGPHQLSDGSLRAIALITALMQPEELMPNIIAIDEPELGLHPSAIALIASLVKAVSSKHQVIVATQSPRFLAEFSPEDIVVVEREENDKGYGHSTFKRLSAADLGDWVKEYDLGTLYEMNVTGGEPR